MHAYFPQKSILLLISFFSVAYCFSQKKNATAKRAVNPKITFEGTTNIPTVLIKVKTRVMRMENGEVKSDKWQYATQTSSTMDGLFFFQLRVTTDPQKTFTNYSIEFIKPGYITKKLFFNTYIPIDEYNRFPFEEYNFDLDLTMKTSKDSDAGGLVKWDSQKRAFIVTKLIEEPAEIKNVVSPSDSSITVDSVEINDQIAFGKNFSISGNLYVNEQNTILSNAKVNLLNSKKQVVRTTTTNSLGSFTFGNLPSGEDYIISVVSVPAKITIKKTVMASHEGKKIAETIGSEKFKYTLAASDSVTRAQLTVDERKLTVNIKGRLISDKEKQIPVSNSKIILKNLGGKIIGTVVTDKDGNFHLENLPADENYSLQLNENDPSLLAKEVFLEDAGGNVLKRLKSKDEKYFYFNFLPPDQNGLSTIFYDDPWLKVASLQHNQKEDSLIIIENIYYDFGKWNVSPSVAVILDKAADAMKKNMTVSIQLISHTDSRGSNETNMELSKKRAAAAVDYIVSKGVAKGRINGKGMGELQLVNKCKDDVVCTEAEHAQNRRTEFRIKNSVK